MGVTLSKDRKKKKKINGNDEKGKENNDDMKRRVTFGKNQSKMTQNLNNDYDTMESKPQIKTEKTTDSTKKTTEDSKNRTNLESIKNLKCLSYDNLVKLENHNFNHEDNLPNSYETNFSSKSGGEIGNNILSDDIYNGLEDNNSIDEEDEEENEENDLNNDKQKEEEEKKKMIY